ncbi:MAG TPA: DNA polymerase IV [Candidatus Blautia gallistercoris]|uniref:DNA polymerase IV n=1 Tax=Candidatus Blautia gallistercoris TaxID=2838490 RepID=A0A9D1WIQ3_9FIRM|nr:DNA polymerase IV [Candidatus Blautia gallistercoris]
MKRTIFHIDVNSAFLSWEAVYRLHFLGGRLDLREIPAAIGGDAAMRHGIILAKSLAAKKFGVRTGESILEARKKCPDLYLAPPNYGLYERCSHAFMEILREYTPVVEPYSIDEAFMDVTEAEAAGEEPVKLANTIKDRICRELGFTVNVGVSSNKLLAKMASDFQKPDLVHTLFPEEIPVKLWPLPVEDLFLVGRATGKKLRNMGIFTIGELAATDRQVIRSHLKKPGEQIWRYANGLDEAPVQQEAPENKGYGNSTTIAFDVTDVRTAKVVLLGLAETVCSRLRRHHVKAGLVSVSIKDFQLATVSHQKVLNNATHVTNEIYQAACSLFDELWNGSPIRHLGIHTGRIQNESASRQLDLFSGASYEKWEQMDQTVDTIRSRFGMDAVKRASFLEEANRQIDHLSGGISREKRTVDYQKIKID